MNDYEDGRGTDAAAIIDFAKGHATPRALPLTWPVGTHSPELLLVPEGFKAESVRKYLDEYRDRPERRKGTARFDELDSFIAHTNRMKDAHSAIFAVRDKARPTITTVIDYHELRDQGDMARFGEHRSLYAPDTSDEWKAWMAADGQAMDQGAFAEFLQDRIADVIAPPISKESWRASAAATVAEGQLLPEDPDQALRDLADKIGGVWADAQRLMELSRGLTVHAAEKVKQAINTNTGETQIQYEAAHHDGTGETLKIPDDEDYAFVGLKKPKVSSLAAFRN